MIIDWLEEWFKGVLIDGIIGNLSGLFDTVNAKVGEIAADVGATPQGWNSGIFNMIRNLSESVIIPIAGAILAFVMTYELIQMVTEKNNLHDIDTFMFFKWVFKTYAAVLIVTNTWNIVMGIFDAAQQVVNQSAGVIIGNQKGENHCYKVLTDYFHLLREWEKKYAPKQPDEEWNPLFAEALHKKNYIEYLLDILLYGSLEERKALVAEQRKEVLKLEQRIAELSADRTMHSRRNPKQLRAERER